MSSNASVNQHNIRLVLEYDGTFFKGWQIQPNQRTVQGELEARLGRLFNQPVRVIGSGRTDTGVHALGQVANFHTSKSMPPDRLQNALNAMLPPDIVIRQAQEVSEKFHARFDAKCREYIYQIGYRKRAIGREYAWWIRSPLDLSAMQQAASMLIGYRDFTSFCVAAKEKEDRRCQVFCCDWHAKKDGVSFSIQANRFLRAMVRSIVGTLVDIGRGARAPDAIAAIIEARDRRCAGASAPPQGLFLKQVIYAGLPGG